MLLMLQRNTGVPVFPDGTEGGRGDANPCANALTFVCVGSGSGDPAVTPARQRGASTTPEPPAGSSEINSGAAQ